MLHRCAVMHKAISIILFKLECAVIDRNPPIFRWRGGTTCAGSTLPKGRWTSRAGNTPCGTPASPRWTRRTPPPSTADEQLVLGKLVASFRQSAKLQQHVRFLYAKGSVYHIENGNLLYHGAVPMTEKGAFAAERFEGAAVRRPRPDGTTATSGPAGLLRPRGQRRPPERPGLFCGTCGAASCRLCSAGAP